MNQKNKLRDIITISMFAAIIFVMKIALALLPNIQLVVLLLVFYTKALGFKKTFIILAIYSILDASFYGGFSIFAPFVFVAWLIIPIALSTIFKKVENSLTLAFLSILFSFLYSWILILPSILIFSIPFWTYLVSDIPFEILLATSSFISIEILYDPLRKLFKTLELK